MESYSEGILLEPKPLEQEQINMVLELVEQRMPYKSIPKYWPVGAHVLLRNTIDESESLVMEFYLNEDDEEAPLQERICIIKHIIDEWDYDEDQQIPDDLNRVLIGMERTRVYGFHLDSKEAYTIHELVSYKREVGIKSYANTDSSWDVTEKMQLNTDHTEELTRILSKFPIID